MIPRAGPVGRVGRALPRAIVYDRTAFWRSGVWWGALIASMFMDLVNYMVPIAPAGPGIYLVIWLVLFAANRRVLPSLPGLAVLPLLYPLLELTSVLWSLSPVQSLKTSVATLFTLFGGYLVTKRVAPRDLILILLLVTFAGGAISLGLGTRREALIGIYGSKNNLSLYSSLLAISGLSLLIERRAYTPVRLMGAAAVMMAPVLLIQGNSVGAMTAIIVACAVVLGCFSFSFVPRQWRLLYGGCLALVGLLAIGFAYVAISGNVDALLAGVGKNSTLTGRVYLWARAEELIRERPLLGHGMAGFWVQGNIDAEGLWRYSMIDTRMGFHFHNLYYQTGVDLGYIGICLLTLWIVATIVAVGLWVLTRPDAESAFFAGLMTFFCLRFYTEVDLPSPYVLSSLVFMTGYVYATQYRRLKPGWSRAVSRPDGPSLR